MRVWRSVCDNCGGLVTVEELADNVTAPTSCTCACGHPLPLLLMIQWELPPVSPPDDEELSRPIITPIYDVRRTDGNDMDELRRRYGDPPSDA